VNQLKNNANKDVGMPCADIDAAVRPVAEGSTCPLH